MKIAAFWCILAVLLHATYATIISSSTDHQRPEGLSLIDDELREFVEFIRLQMPCGYPAGGIPPLAPYQFNYTDFHMKRGAWEFKGNFSDFSLAGLDGFEFAKLSWNNLLQKTSFDANFESLKFSSSYKMDAFGSLINHKSHIFGNGLLRLELKNLRVYGSFKLRPTLNGGLQIWAFKVKLSLGKAHSTTTGIMNSKIYSTAFNRWFEEFLDLTINEGTEEVSAFIEHLVLPPLNNALNKVSLKQLLEIIRGLGGKSSSNISNLLTC